MTNVRLGSALCVHRVVRKGRGPLTAMQKGEEAIDLMVDLPAQQSPSATRTTAATFRSLPPCPLLLRRTKTDTNGAASPSNLRMYESIRLDGGPIPSQPPNVYKHQLGPTRAKTSHHGTHVFTLFLLRFQWPARTPQSAQVQAISSARTYVD